MNLGIYLDVILYTGLVSRSPMDPHLDLDMDSMVVPDPGLGAAMGSGLVSVVAVVSELGSGAVVGSSSGAAVGLGLELGVVMGLGLELGIGMGLGLGCGAALAQAQVDSVVPSVALADNAVLSVAHSRHTLTHTGSLNQDIFVMLLHLLIPVFVLPLIFILHIVH